MVVMFDGFGCGVGFLRCSMVYDVYVLCSFVIVIPLTDFPDSLIWGLRVGTNPLFMISFECFAVLNWTTDG
ncbi:hypothetical protein A2U01_0020591, partial [Trifolium medium]|nr:hypothetical protein [Trifolium medium]